jgi:hypothetical protein
MSGTGALGFTLAAGSGRMLIVVGRQDGIDADSPCRRLGGSAAEAACSGTVNFAEGAMGRGESLSCGAVIAVRKMKNAAPAPLYSAPRPGL